MKNLSQSFYISETLIEIVNEKLLFHSHKFANREVLHICFDI